MEKRELSIVFELEGMNRKKKQCRKNVKEFSSELSHKEFPVSKSKINYFDRDKETEAVTRKNGIIMVSNLLW